MQRKSKPKRYNYIEGALHAMATDEHERLVKDLTRVLRKLVREAVRLAATQSNATFHVDPDQIAKELIR